MAVFNISNLNNFGAGNLRQATFDLNGLRGAKDTIEFSRVTETISAELVPHSLTINGLGAGAEHLLHPNLPSVSVNVVPEPSTILGVVAATALAIAFKCKRDR